MARPSIELAGRSAVLTLTAWNGVSEPVWESLLTPTHADCAAWRVIDLFTTGPRLPWRVEIGWGAGGAAGQVVQLSIARATRVCVFASSLLVRAQNWAQQQHTVTVAVANGFDPTRNQLEFQDDVDAGFPLEIAIPAFADRVHVEVANRAIAGTTEIHQWDAAGNDVGMCFVADLYGGPGIPCGHLSHIEIVSPAATKVRVVFTLRI